MEALFVYGTLSDPLVQREIFGRILEAEADRLNGFKKTSIVIQGINYPAVVPEDSSRVGGFLIFVSEADLIKSDDYETDAYFRKEIVLASGKKAWVYQLNQAKTP